MSKNLFKLLTQRQPSSINLDIVLDKYRDLIQDLESRPRALQFLKQLGENGQSTFVTCLTNIRLSEPQEVLEDKIALPIVGKVFAEKDKKTYLAVRHIDFWEDSTGLLDLNDPPWILRMIELDDFVGSIINHMEISATVKIIHKSTHWGGRIGTSLEQSCSNVLFTDFDGVRTFTCQFELDVEEQHKVTWKKTFKTVEKLWKEHRRTTLLGEPPTYI